jgi:uncharacterized protein
VDVVFDFFRSYKVIFIPTGAWFIAQAVKLIIELLKKRHFDIGIMMSMGGMPSAHSATVSSLATMVGLMEGFNSPVFAISLFFAFIVMYDAGGVRQTVSSQSDMLNRILDELLKGHPRFDERLREFIGHSQLEIAIGCVLGILLALWWT